MFYATFKDVGDCDVAEFRTENERNDWVNFLDDFSLAFGSNKETAAFQRMTLSEPEARRLISKSLWKEYEPHITWYCL